MILNPWQLSQCLCVNTMNRVPRKWEVGGKDKGVHAGGKNGFLVQIVLTLMLLSSRQSVF